MRQHCHLLRILYSFPLFSGLSARPLLTKAGDLHPAMFADHLDNGAAYGMHYNPFERASKQPRLSSPYDDSLLSSPHHGVSPSPQSQYRDALLTDDHDPYSGLLESVVRGPPRSTKPSQFEVGTGHAAGTLPHGYGASPSEEHTNLHDIWDIGIPPENVGKLLDDWNRNIAPFDQFIGRPPLAQEGDWPTHFTEHFNPEASDAASSTGPQHPDSPRSTASSRSRGSYFSDQLPEHYLKLKSPDPDHPTSSYSGDSSSVPQKTYEHPESPLRDSDEVSSDDRTSLKRKTPEQP